MLGLIRENLFQPRLTVERIKRVLGVGANDLTTRFRAAAGAPICARCARQQAPELVAALA